MLTAAKNDRLTAVLHYISTFSFVKYTWSLW